MRLSVWFARALVALVALALFTPVAARAQLTITLEGSVRGPEGQMVTQGDVTVTNPATNERRTARITDVGRFRVLGLAPGRYAVAVRAIGYAPSAQSVELLLGQRANIVFDLERKATELGEVAVTAQRTTPVEVQRTSVSAPVVHEQIEKLPTIDRNIMTLAAIAPGVKGFAPQAGRALPSAGAVPDLRFINFYLDGIELKSLFNGNLVGIPQTGAPLPQESIQEFRVFLNPYDAEYSHAGAYVLSAESNRGTNELHGSAFGFLQNKDMVAKTVFQKAAPNFNRSQLGFNVRGPIRRDRAFFAVNYEVTNSNNYIDVVPGRPAANPAIWDRYKGSFKAPNLNHTGFLRGTFTPSDRNTVDAEWAVRYMTSESNFGATVAREGGIDQSYLIHVAQIRDRFLPTPNTLNELSLQFVRWHHDEGPLVPGPQRVYPSITLGTATFPLLLNETHWRLIDRASYTRDGWMGSHVFKAGVEASHIAADQFSPNFRDAQFRFGQDTATVPNQAVIGIGYPNTSGTGDALADLSGWITGAYLNDEWRASPTLTLNLGVRYDAEINTLNNDYTVPWASDTAITNRPQISPYLNRGDRKNDLNNFSPRLSFSWDPFGTNRTFIRGGAGIIYDRVASFIGFQERLAASWRSYTIANPGTMDVDVLRGRVISGTVPSTPNVVLVKHLMQAPENRQLSFGVGHQMTPSLALNLDYVHQDVRHLYTRLNLNYRDFSTNTAGPRKLTPRYGDIIVWDDFGRAKFDAFVFSTAYQRPKLLSNLAYTLGWYRADYDAVTAPAYAYRSSYNMQRTAGDERHRLVLSEVATLPWGFELSGIGTIASPRPYGAFIGQDLNRDNDLTDDFFPTGDPAGQRTQRPRNAWNRWYRNVDLRVGKSLLASRGTTLRITAEIFNVFNTNNVAGYNGRQRDQAGALLTTYGRPNAAFGARRGQVGLRAEF
ncbi:MAG TPA: carboxypeptidase regulatory-like domain-containing protein [Gemmatimonadaceae bacterium]|nr:carboxypeptidase regulatory-like domain-containing protein [Gemmatimonadaceae bacterium]